MEEDDMIYTYHFDKDDSSESTTNDDQKNAIVFVKFLKTFYDSTL